MSVLFLAKCFLFVALIFVELAFLVVATWGWTHFNSDTDGPGSAISMTLGSLLGAAGLLGLLHVMFGVA